MRLIALLCSTLILGGCSQSMSIPAPKDEPTLMPRGATYLDLTSLPLPRGPVYVSVYDFRDQTGQYKPQPNSNFSTAVPQGGAAMLTTALLNSKWFIPLEREGLQNLLTERKIIRAAQSKHETPKNHGNHLPSLMAANIMVEGGIIAYDTNIQTGGAGARYLGIGLSSQYRTDQVTVNVRAVDIRSGRILLSVTTSKTILSQELQTGIFKFIDYKDLLEAELGITTNEPVNVAVMSAIDSAVIQMVVDGIKTNLWKLRNPSDMSNPVIQKYAGTTQPII
ncbi:CsgG/HfaB family protein [Photobacterium halotolerans]|uniref:CsgG/HfaB family protein n=1 Tax=Photobacterium halotolerans TaxID=265726 RepID=UPI0004852741|nr:CsgG/HfaB family protein [Photobacterium halotolerans]NAW88846.1 curli production assembly/transport protein CsgG [Photobacterium halotolerans]NAX46191.1 curli production assembly/transport protein CsgG [Photobacterium halotolerans]